MKLNTFRSADAAKDPGGSRKYSNDRDVSQDMYTDGNRLNFSFNGVEVKCDPGSPRKAIDAFKATVTNPAMRRGLSSIMHQTSILAFTSLSNRATLPSTSQHKTGEKPVITATCIAQEFASI